MIIYYINAAMLIVFLFSHLQDRRRLLNGFLFNLLLIVTGASLATLAYTSQNTILMIFVGILLFLVLLFMSFGAFIIMIVSFVNARTLIKKEGRKFSDLLTFFLGLGILLFFISNLVYGYHQKIPTMVTTLFLLFNVFIVYFLLVFANFIMSSFVYRLYRPRVFVDYIIELGSGLINGENVYTRNT